jgi:hypothetical protein
MVPLRTSRFTVLKGLRIFQSVRDETRVGIVRCAQQKIGARYIAIDPGPAARWLNDSQSAQRPKRCRRIRRAIKDESGHRSDCVRPSSVAANRNSLILKPAASIAPRYHRIPSTARALTCAMCGWTFQRNHQEWNSPGLPMAATHGTSAGSANARGERPDLWRPIGEHWPMHSSLSWSLYGP